MKQIIFAIGFILIGITVAMTTQISQQAQAVVIGIVCGISAATPLTIGLVIANSQRATPQPRTESRVNRGDQLRALTPSAPTYIEGTFKIIGDSE